MATNLLVLDNAVSEYYPDSKYSVGCSLNQGKNLHGIVALAKGEEKRKGAALDRKSHCGSRTKQVVAKTQQHILLETR